MTTLIGGKLPLTGGTLTGNLGIGITTPLHLLDVKGGDGNSLRLGFSNYGGGHLRIDGVDKSPSGVTSSFNHTIRFKTKTDNSNAGNGAEVDAMLLYHEGWSGNHVVSFPSSKVGIGTTSPTQKLDVTGTVKATAFVGDGSNLTGVDAAIKSATPPSSPSQGDLWFNTSTGAVSGVGPKAIASYNGTTWDQLSNVPVMEATGGTITTDGVYKVHTFTSGGIFNVTSMPGKIDVIIVGGGGGGGMNNWTGAGGGGGEVKYFTTTSTVRGYTITLGGGGGGACSNSTNGGNGGTTTFDSTSSYGGNVHGINFNCYKSGNSNTCGTGGGSSGSSWSGGGGGAGGAGSGPTGGSGLLVTTGYFAGNTTYYGAGAGAGSEAGYGNTYAGTGGTGRATGTSSISGSANTGAGGGGGSLQQGYCSAAGGSGIVIVRYIG
jgi:hypothetical protein